MPPIESRDDDYKDEFYKRAVKHYTRGAELDSGDISFLIKRAKAHFWLQEYEDCVSDCDEAVERGRELRSSIGLVADALSWKGSALLELAACAADYEPAITALRLSLRLCPGNKETRAKLDEAESVKKSFEDQEAADHHQDEGQELLSQGKWEEAAAQFTEAIKMNPTDPKNFSDRAKCHIKLNVLAKGLEDADRCIELDPTFCKGYLRKGDVQLLNHNYEGAMATYLAGLKYGPQKAYIHDRLKRCVEHIIEMANDSAAKEELVKEIEYLRNELQKSMDEAEEFKEEASDERLRRSELEQMVKALGDSCTSRVEQLIIEHGRLLQEANKHNANLERQLSEYREHNANLEDQLSEYGEHNANLERQLSECRGDFERLLSIQNRIQTHFICPISQEVMHDPHIAADGHTYEAQEISHWLVEHNTSPMTNLPLEHIELTPNHTLRSAIQEWCQHQNMAP
ncbi:hypothetical protein E2562_003511 [Oryza meyeriana var. granulata]|uniref:U-box domain-containing protein n=1 Tax=Oryza meyeriana var. granulata TaxID=110450 RepID=A0A6G1CN41_9ORYZ|nr:hypothetical protein E2562_003511 [Oryza meyeriana var. granulata]